MRLDDRHRVGRQFDSIAGDPNFFFRSKQDTRILAAA
jgi:hypothetical protein